ncbi:MAG: hypothetical protein KAS22_14095, partial [Candidatus Heimdallarchaeota archaeon]|nr:hypothetical protein [Candidatus Heimdallarchaeota archaeon]
MMVISICFLSGCTENQTGVLTSSKPPVNINRFASATEGEFIRFYFLLESEDGENAIGNGQVKIEILDDLENILYKDEFDIKKSEFVDYQFQLTGTGMGKAFEWRVASNNIEKGISSFGFGKAVLTFISEDLRTMSAEDTLVQIPTYSEEEIEAMQEEEYEKKAISLNKKQSKGSFEVTVTKAGFFDKNEWGTLKNYFRVDMEVKNI